MGKVYRILLKSLSLFLLILLLYYINLLKYNDKIKIKDNIINVDPENIYENNIHDSSINDNNYNEKHTKILRDTAAECTLFLNKNNEFPINSACNVLLLGNGARKTLKGGFGSGDVYCDYTTCEEGLEKAGFKITTKEWLNQNQYPYLKDNNEPKSDIAIYVLSRNSGEQVDRTIKKGDLLLTDKEINDILYLNKKYKKFMLVLNVCGVVDLSPVKEVSNILLLSQLGVVTGDILSDIILGKQNPSGKLATTWASLNDYKFIHEFGIGEDTNYIEGVYVGYRYFDSAGIKPLYPFGFGKSYTYFNISKISLINIKDEIEIKVKVKNIGNYPGKEVIQAYVSPSQENEIKPYQSLVAFNKTRELKPLEEVEIDIIFKLRDVARFDEKKACYILDKGKYIIRLGDSSDNTKIYGYLELDEDIITQQLKNINVKDLGFEEYKPTIILKDQLNNIQNIKLTKNDFDFLKIEYNYEYKINDKIANLKDEELASLCIGDYSNILKAETGVCGLTTMNVKEIKNFIKMADGPAGLRFNIMLNSRYTTTAIPIETALAQTFNVELVEKFGNIIGKEMELLDIHLWLAPAMNIHRNVLCGRNFEYFSEDPLITGKMAAAIIKSVQSYKNKGTTIKHFVANNQETNRYNSNSKMSERALREIYLRGFQIAIQEAHPHALMTSYNIVDGIRPSQNKELLIDVLRSEWGFKGLIMSDWSFNTMYDKSSKYPAQNVFDNIRGGNNIMMPGTNIDYNLLLTKLNNKELSRDDLLHCSSKVYETIELLNK